jgi:tryptophan synthase alpha chain
MGALEERLRAVRRGGAKAFVPYVTGGLPGVDAKLLRGLETAGADAIEVGIPHSDPIMDGGVIQEASRIALERGTSPNDVLMAVRDAARGVPVAVSTYLNPR